MRFFRCFLAILLGFAALSGCKNRGAEAREEAPSTRPQAPQPPATSPSQASQRPPAVSVEESERICGEAKALTQTDLRKAIGILEQAISKNPDDPAAAKYYLLLARLSKQYENYQVSSDNDAQGEYERRTKEFREYAESHPGAYFHDEPGDAFLYNGLHFKEVTRRFPASPEAVEAAYEITNLSQGGECEGQLTCYIEAEFEPVRRFLNQYPDSPHTAEAVQRANDAFRKTLWGERWKTDWTEVRDPNQSTDFYDPAELKRLVGEYEDLAEKLPLRFRASA